MALQAIAAAQVKGGCSMVSIQRWSWNCWQPMKPSLGPLAEGGLCYSFPKAVTVPLAVSLA